MAEPRKKRAPSGGPRTTRMREEILREWRGGPEADDLSANIHLAEAFVTAILRSAGAEEGLHEDQVKEAWKDLAGDFISRHAEPVSMKGGHLVLRVTQPAMRFHLEQMKPMLLGRIRERLGEDKVKSVKFALG